MVMGVFMQQGNHFC